MIIHHHQWLKMWGITGRFNGNIVVQDVKGKMLEGTGQKQDRADDCSRRSVHQILQELETLIWGQCG